ncbi:MAG: energy transducer TonB [Acidobacteria bacterium]|nr:energy transducer TonB [Acidobacteriota bacterium]
MRSRLRNCAIPIALAAVAVAARQYPHGHPLLQQAEVFAARRARFLPMTLGGSPVKVSGVITYNFVPV